MTEILRERGEQRVASPTRRPLRIPDLGPSRPPLRPTRYHSRGPWLVGALLLLLILVGGFFVYRNFDDRAPTGSLAPPPAIPGPLLSAPRQIVPTVPGYVSELR